MAARTSQDDGMSAQLTETMLAEIEQHLAGEAAGGYATVDRWLAALVAEVRRAREAEGELEDSRGRLRDRAVVAEAERDALRVKVDMFRRADATRQAEVHAYRTEVDALRTRPGTMVVCPRCSPLDRPGDARA